VRDLKRNGRHSQEPWVASPTTCCDQLTEFPRLSPTSQHSTIARCPQMVLTYPQVMCQVFLPSCVPNGVSDVHCSVLHRRACAVPAVGA
jgi:hypothetical protein